MHRFIDYPVVEFTKYRSRIEDIKNYDYAKKISDLDPLLYPRFKKQSDIESGSGSLLVSENYPTYTELLKENDVLNIIVDDFMETAVSMTKIMLSGGKNQTIYRTLDTTIHKMKISPGEKKETMKINTFVTTLNKSKMYPARYRNLIIYMYNSKQIMNMIKTACDIENDINRQTDIPKTKIPKLIIKKCENHDHNMSTEDIEFIVLILQALEKFGCNQYSLTYVLYFFLHKQIDSIESQVQKLDKLIDDYKKNIGGNPNEIESDTVSQAQSFVEPTDMYHVQSFVEPTDMTRAQPTVEPIDMYQVQSFLEPIDMTRAQPTVQPIDMYQVQSFVEPIDMTRAQPTVEPIDMTRAQPTVERCIDYLLKNDENFKKYDICIFDEKFSFNEFINELYKNKIFIHVISKYTKNKKMLEKPNIAKFCTFFL